MNGCTSYDVTDVKYAKEIKEYKEWLESEDEMFIAHKKDNKIDFWTGPSIDEALNILHKAWFRIIPSGIIFLFDN